MDHLNSSVMILQLSSQRELSLAPYCALNGREGSRLYGLETGFQRTGNSIVV